VVFVDGTASSTSLRDDRGNPLSAETLGAVWVETEPSKSSLTQRSLELGNFAGYDDTPNDEVVAAGPHAVSWYIDTRALDPASRVQLALLVPTSIMTVGARIALVALVVGALMLLVAAALIVARFGGAFIRPLERLSESARRVSVGDLSMRVEISEGHEMAPFAVIYNSMLDRLRELITNRSRLSRQAGMADIAASVLHNVGNALTGVRTGVELAEESLQRLPVRHARRLAELLEHNRADPGAFFGPGGRGERVPDFVRELATNLEHSHAETQHELRRAATSAEHAAAAVRAQQRHARPVDLVERCLVHEVVDDALNIAGIERSEGIEVCRDYTRVEAWIDRHRLVQIVLNLANNARDAIASTERHRGRIDLVVSLDPGRGVRVRVIDDGIGVRPEDRDRIFSMGHTTKENGHGVGLHGSANLAAEMGGSLRLEIPANGVGATFELTLPLRMPSRSPLEADDRLAPAGTG
jgi:signal transduction histidine kinase